jgi:hypothetical protein
MVHCSLRLLVVEHANCSGGWSSHRRRRFADRFRVPPRYFERHEMQVETALRVFAGVAQLEQIEDRLDIA